MSRWTYTIGLTLTILATIALALTEIPPGIQADPIDSSFVGNMAALAGSALA